MQENRMFSDVKLAKRLTPAWLSPFLAVFLLVVGQIIGAIVMSISAALIIAPYYMTHPELPDRLSDSLNLREIFGDYYLLVTLLSFVFIAGLFFLWVKLFEKTSDCYPRILQRQLEERAVQRLWSRNSSLLCCDVDPHFDRILSISWHYFYTLCIRLCSSHYSVLADSGRNRRTYHEGLASSCHGREVQ